MVVTTCQTQEYASEQISFAQNGLVCILNQVGMFTDDYVMKICTGGSTEVANAQLSIMEIRRSVRMVP